MAQTDLGKEIQGRIDDLLALQAAFRDGAVAEDYGREQREGFGV